MFKRSLNKGFTSALTHILSPGRSFCNSGTHAHQNIPSLADTVMNTSTMQPGRVTTPVLTSLNKAQQP